MQEAEKIAKLIKDQFQPIAAVTDDIVGCLVVELDWGTDRVRFSFDGARCERIEACADLKIHLTNLTVLENLTLGPEDAPAVAGFLKSAQDYKIPFETLTAAEVRRRWPRLTPADSFVAGLETRAAESPRLAKTRFVVG